MWAAALADLSIRGEYCKVGLRAASLLLGFPFGWTTGGQHLNRGFPFPFVKGGIVAAYSLGGPVFTLFLDTHVNHGFSGGPVVFRPKEGRAADIVLTRAVPPYR